MKRGSGDILDGIYGITKFSKLTEWGDKEYEREEGRRGFFDRINKINGILTGEDEGAGANWNFAGTGNVPKYNLERGKKNERLLPPRRARDDGLPKA
jgi:hypothetical protein